MRVNRNTLFMRHTRRRQRPPAGAARQNNPPSIRSRQIRRVKRGERQQNTARNMPGRKLVRLAHIDKHNCSGSQTVPDVINRQIRNRLMSTQNRSPIFQKEFCNS
jgi:hypothetical protein